MKKYQLEGDVRRTFVRVGIDELLQVSLEFLVEVFAHADVLEHALQFGRVLEAAGLLQNDRSRH